jgi:small-conductance mechanosensitive channel
MNELANAFLEPATEIGPKIPGAVLDLLVGYLIIKIVMFFFKRFVRILRTSAAVKSILVKLTETLLWAFLVLYILNYLGLGNLVVAFTGSVVLIGFILNNGLAQAISDVFAGLELSKDKDFRVGITVSTNEEKIEGEIVSMNLRKVKLIDSKGRLHIVPNSLFDKNEWILIKEKDESNKPKK